MYGDRRNIPSNLFLRIDTLDGGRLPFPTTVKKRNVAIPGLLRSVAVVFQQNVPIVKISFGFFFREIFRPTLPLEELCTPNPAVKGCNLTIVHVKRNSTVCWYTYMWQT